MRVQFSRGRESFAAFVSTNPVSRWSEVKGKYPVKPPFLGKSFVPSQRHVSSHSETTGVRDESRCRGIAADCAVEAVCDNVQENFILLRRTHTLNIPIHIRQVYRVPPMRLRILRITPVPRYNIVHWEKDL